MSFSLIEDIRTVAELDNNLRTVAAHVHETGRPLIVTSNGKPDVVVLDAATYERHLKLANLAKLLRQAEEDVDAGRTRPVKDFLKEFKRAKKISR